MHCKVCGAPGYVSPCYSCRSKGHGLVEQPLPAPPLPAPTPPGAGPKWVQEILNILPEQSGTTSMPLGPTGMTGPPTELKETTRLQGPIGTLKTEGKFEERHVDFTAYGTLPKKVLENPAFQHLHRIFHKLWSRSVSQPGYVKDDWIEFESALDDIVKRWLALETAVDELVKRIEFVETAMVNRLAATEESKTEQS